MCYDLPCSRRVEKLLIIALVETLFIAKDRVCFLPIAILLRQVAVYRIVCFNQAINRLNKIAIGRKQTRPFAINKVSTDAIIIVLHSEGAANHNTCLYGERF